jgi:hypothetical protein
VVGPYEPPVCGSGFLDSVRPAVETLRAQVESTGAALERAASQSYLAGDPVKEHLHAMSMAMTTMLNVCEVGAAVQQEIAASLDEKAEEVADQALAHVKASTDEIVTAAVPRVLALTESTARQKFALAKRKMWLVGGGLVLLGQVLFGGYVYSVGFSNGHMKGEMTAIEINQAMESGPKAADAWGMLMSHNNPLLALAACEKNVSKNAQGWLSCSMPVWIGAAPAAPTS